MTMLKTVYTFHADCFTKHSFYLNLWSQHQDTNNTPEIILSFAEIFCSFIGIFCVCDFGQRIGDTFEKINMLIEQLNWYLFPCDTQPMLTIISIVAQRPVELEIFGSMSCNRRTFKKVCTK